MNLSNRDREWFRKMLTEYHDDINMKLNALKEDVDDLKDDIAQVKEDVETIAENTEVKLKIKAS